MKLSKWISKPWGLFWGHLVFALLLWFFTFTEYSWFGSLLDLFSPIFLFYLARELWMKRHEVQKWRFLFAFSAIPSFVLLFIYLLSIVVFIFYAGILGGGFWFTELLGEVPKNSTISPNGLFLATVHVRPVGPYTGGQGRAYIGTSLSFFPLIERDVFFLPKYLENVSVRWGDENTLVVEDGSLVNGVYQSETVKLDEAKIEPISISFPVAVYYGILEAQERKRELEKLAKKTVNDLPAHPKTIKGSDYVLDYENGLHRSIRIKDSNSPMIVAWIQEQLKKRGWEVVPEKIIAKKNDKMEQVCFPASKKKENLTIYVEVTRYFDVHFTNVEIATYSLCY